MQLFQSLRELSIILIYIRLARQAMRKAITRLDIKRRRSGRTGDGNKNIVGIPFAQVAIVKGDSKVLLLLCFRDCQGLS